MQGPSHLIISWFAAEAVGVDSPRERRIIALSGLAPDVDVLAYVVAIVYYGFDKDLAFELVWQPFHHRFTHGLGFVLLTGLIALLLASRHGSGGPTGFRRAAGVAGLSMAASMIHVFCDVVGGGPTWPVYPLWPLSDVGWAVNWSWTLADWPNSAILFACLAGGMIYASVSGYSPLESISYKLDRWFVKIIQQGSDAPAEHEGVPGSGVIGHKRAMRVRVLVYFLLALLIVAVLAPLYV